MELKKAMERKTNILQLVSMCLGAVLALSMVLLPANAAFADDMQDVDPFCEFLAQSLARGENKYWDEKENQYWEQNCMQYRDRSCEDLDQTLPPYFKEDLQNVKEELNYYCGPDAPYGGRECDRTKEYYESIFPEVMKYIEYKCEEFEPTIDLSKNQSCEDLKIKTNSFGFSKNQSCKDSKIADSVLSSSCRRRDGSYNNTSIDLNPYIENVDGRLMWQPGNFIETCRNTALSCASVMTAECKTRDQRSIETYIDLDEHIANIDGVFEYK